MRERTPYSGYSNYRSIDRSSPRKQININSELDDHSNRIKELLRADLIMLEEENAILKAKNKKLPQLQDKAEILQKQNSQLLSENERLSKLLNQKKVQYDTLRQKYEMQSNQKLEYASGFEYQRKKLLSELEHLDHELKEVQQIKNAQINELKSQFQIEFQTIKRQTASSQEMYEQEIRKLRDQLDKKDYELSENVNRLKRLSSEAEYDVLRLKEEKQKLRSELTYVESDRKKQLQSIRGKLENNYLEQIESIKKSHLASLQGFQLQNNKLKDLLENKNIELELVSGKLNKQKNTYEDAIAMTKRENEMLRNKMVQFERLSQSDKDTLKVKLNKVHESQIDEMRINHQKYIDTLHNENSKLESALSKKNAEIEQLIKEKTAVRQMYDSEGNRFKDQIETLLFKLKDFQSKQTQLVITYEQKLKEKTKHIDYLDRLNQDQTENHLNQIKTIKQLLQHSKKDLESERVRSREKQQQLQESLQEAKNDNSVLRDTLSKDRLDKDKHIQDLTYQLQGTISALKTKLDSISSRNNILEREQISLKQTIDFKQKEIKNLQERVRVSEERERKLERQNDDLRNKLIKKDQKSNEMLAQQKQRLQATFAFTIDNLKMDHQSALKLQANKQADLLQKLRRKDNQLDDLLKAYKKMRDQMEVLTEQQANKKEMTLKFPGATADLIATKNLFDVYLKSRVLDICADAKGKENSKS